MKTKAGELQVTLDGVPLHIDRLEYTCRTLFPTCTVGHQFDLTAIISNTDFVLEKYVRQDINLMKKAQKFILNQTYGAPKMPEIEKVIFNPPATIILWSDKEKTVVKAQPNEPYDPEKGLAMAVTKRMLGNKGNYYDQIKDLTYGAPIHNGILRYGGLVISPEIFDLPDYMDVIAREVKKMKKIRDDFRMRKDDYCED